MLCTYPYSLKLFWSPIVDSTFVNELQLPLIGKLSHGRRKSWIVPIQTIVGVMFWYLSRNVDQLLLADLPNVKLITLIFFVLILFAATQDIAVDGWALTLLSQENLSYASTAQTVGLNSGYFLSFTVFLAFNSVEFSNKYFRSTPLDYPLLSLSAYMRFWAVGFIVVTAWLLFFQKEDEEADDAPDMDVKKVYLIMWRICQLKHVQTFILIHFVAKIGFQANEAVTGLKLVERDSARRTSRWRCSSISLPAHLWLSCSEVEQGRQGVAALGGGILLPPRIRRAVHGDRPRHAIGTHRSGLLLRGHR